MDAWSFQVTVLHPSIGKFDCVEDGFTEDTKKWYKFEILFREQVHFLFPIHPWAIFTRCVGNHWNKKKKKKGFSGLHCRMQTTPKCTVRSLLTSWFAHMGHPHVLALALMMKSNSWKGYCPSASCCKIKVYQLINIFDSRFFINSLLCLNLSIFIVDTLIPK